MKERGKCMDEPTEQTRVCSNPKCEYKGQPQPLNKQHFAEQGHYALGFKTRCRACDRSARRERYKKKKQDELAYNRQWVKTHRTQRNTYLKKRNTTIMTIYHEATKQETS